MVSMERLLNDERYEMNKGNYKILVTLGPSSLKEDVINNMDHEGIYLFRINLSHTNIDDLPHVIETIQTYTDTPICIDSEGAQIRNSFMEGDAVDFIEGESIKIDGNQIIGDKNNISFTPDNICSQLEVGDLLEIDYNLARIRVTKKLPNACHAVVEVGGMVGSNKAVDVNKEIELQSITPKDKEAINIGKKYRIRHFALSFASSEESVNNMRELIGNDATIISKVESRIALDNLDEILKASDSILIDRGDLSRQVPLEKIPFLQRRIISIARSRNVPVFVATNLLESMINAKEPTRAEINDVVSTMLMGADGLVLAAETAVGKHPEKSVKMLSKLMNQINQWTPNSSIDEILTWSTNKVNM
jgi:pyruvate kinase